MRDWLILSIAADVDLTHRETFAELDEADLRREVARGGLAQEIDIQIDCDR